MDETRGECDGHKGPWQICQGGEAGWPSRKGMAVARSEAADERSRRKGKGRKLRPPRWTRGKKWPNDLDEARSHICGVIC